jgi:ribosomal protein L21E
MRKSTSPYEDVEYVRLNDDPYLWAVTILWWNNTMGTDGMDNSMTLKKVSTSDERKTLWAPFGQEFREIAKIYRSETVYHIREKLMEFQVGDKVRTKIGTVIQANERDHVNVSFDGTTTGKYYYKTDSLELVERPVKDPEFGSLWSFNGVTTGKVYVYLGRATVGTLDYNTGCHLFVNQEVPDRVFSWGNVIPVDLKEVKK